MSPAVAVDVAVAVQVNSDGVFRYAYVPWFSQALQVLSLSGVHGVAVDVWVSSLAYTQGGGWGGCACVQAAGRQERSCVGVLARIPAHT